MRKYYPGITLYKLGGCLLVLLAHVILFRYTDRLPQTRLYYFFNELKIVVPCFYVISGFLLVQGWTRAGDPDAYVRRYVMRFGGVYAVFCLAFALKELLPALIYGGLTPANALLQAKTALLMFLLEGPYVQLWFIPPLLWAVLVCYWLHTRCSPRTVLLLTCLAFGAGQLLCGTLRVGIDALAGGIPLLENRYGGYVEELVERYLGYGFVFVSVGMWIGRSEQRFMAWRPLRLAALTGTVVLLEAPPLFWSVPWQPRYALTLGMLPGTLLLLRGVLGIRAETVRTYHPFINRFSMVMFFGHIPLMRLNLLVGGGAQAVPGWGSGWIYMAVTIVETALIALLLHRTRRNDGVPRSTPLAS